MHLYKSILIVTLFVALSYSQEDWGASTIPLTPGTIYTSGNAPSVPDTDDLLLTDSINSGQGIIWYLSSPRRVGQFVNLDWYVVGQCTVSHIDPHPLFGNDEVGADTAVHYKEMNEELFWPDSIARNGSELNPYVVLHAGLSAANERVGFDSRMSGPIGFPAYNPSRFAHLPIVMPTYSSLMSTISKGENEITDFTSHGKTLWSASVLTCVENPLPADAFRPSYRHDSLRTFFYARNLKRNLLYDLTLPANAPSISEWIRKFQQVWVDHIEFSNSAFPEYNEPEYGQWHSWATSTVSLMLHLNYPAEEKEKLLINFIQRGIDLWGIAKAGYKGWPGQGGYGSGRYWAILFAGVMLGDTTMQHPIENAPDSLFFGELMQTKYGSNWKGDTAIFESHPKPTFRPIIFGETYHPGEWNGLTRPKNGMQSNSYRVCCTSTCWPGQALSVLFMRKKTLYNHDAFFDYVDRWMEEDLSALWDTVNAVYTARIAAGDTTWGPLLPSSVTYWKTTAKTMEQDDFVQVMWNTYRNNMPPALEGNQRKKCVVTRINYN